jgi:hypothetical protein
MTRPLPSEGSALSPFTPEQEARVREIVMQSVGQRFGSRFKRTLGNEAIAIVGREGPRRLAKTTPDGPESRE